MIDLYLRTQDKQTMDSFLVQAQTEWEEKNLGSSFFDFTAFHEIGYLQKQTGSVMDPELNIEVPTYEDDVAQGWLVNVRTTDQGVVHTLSYITIDPPETPVSVWA